MFMHPDSYAALTGESPTAAVNRRDIARIILQGLPLRRVRGNPQGSVADQQIKQGILPDAVRRLDHIPAVLRADPEKDRAGGIPEFSTDISNNRHRLAPLLSDQNTVAGSNIRKLYSRDCPPCSSLLKV